jgi:tRNA U54 and U55 pseudouridine synthase Pus10
MYQEDEPFHSGDTVLVVPYDELKQILAKFSPTLDCIKPLKIEDVADHYCTILDVIVTPEPKLGVEDFAVLVMDDGRDLVLPLKAFRSVNIQINEIDESMDYRLPISKSNPTVLSQELLLVQNAAAECIQSAFRRYLVCKKAIQSRRKHSSDQLVLNMAAETITKNLRR